MSESIMILKFIFKETSKSRRSSINFKFTSRKIQKFFVDQFAKTKENLLIALEVVTQTERTLGPISRLNDDGLSEHF
jgi:hypothetical protein